VLLAFLFWCCRLQGNQPPPFCQNREILKLETPSENIRSENLIYKYRNLKSYIPRPKKKQVTAFYLCIICTCHMFFVYIFSHLPTISTKEFPSGSPVLSRYHAPRLLRQLHAPSLAGELVLVVEPTPISQNGNLPYPNKA